MESITSAHIVTSRSGERRFEEALPYSHRGEAAQVHTVQLFMQHGLLPENAYQEPRWGKTEPVQSM